MMTRAPTRHPSRMVTFGWSSDARTDHDVTAENHVVGEHGTFADPAARADHDMRTDAHVPAERCGRVDHRCRMDARRSGS